MFSGCFIGSLLLTNLLSFLWFYGFLSWFFFYTLSIYHKLLLCDYHKAYTIHVIFNIGYFVLIVTLIAYTLFYTSTILFTCYLVSLWPHSLSPDMQFAINLLVLCGPGRPKDTECLQVMEPVSQLGAVKGGAIIACTLLLSRVCCPGLFVTEARVLIFLFRLIEISHALSRETLQAWIYRRGKEHIESPPSCAGLRKLILPCASGSCFSWI